ncbi:MAG: SDR family NAD(P)-dependent oxidoreductase [Pseudomonadota bacterium]
MSHFAGKTYWLVGASEGLGEALAHQLSALGASVILSARNEDRLKTVAESVPGTARVVTIDIADDASVASAAEAAGDVDGLVFLAGIYWPMPATEWDLDQGVAMADVNFTGAFRVLGHVVPKMVAKDAGHIVITGSLSGFRGLPGAIGYGASKAGVMSLAESLRADLWRTGINVQLGNPGFIKTRLTDKNDFKMPFLMTSEDAAGHMVSLMNNPRKFQSHFPMVFSWMFRLSRLLPDWLYYRIFS